MTYPEMAALQAQPYQFKRKYAEAMVYQFYEEAKKTYVDARNRIVGKSYDEAAAWEEGNKCKRK